MTRNRRIGRLARLPVSVALIAIVVFFITRTGRGRPKCIYVYAADGLAASFERIREEFERQHPDTEVRLQIYGSVLLVRLAPLKRCDVAAVADARLVERVLAPEYASWAAKFATSEIVVAGTDASKYRSEMTSENWYGILLRNDVRYAYADPTLDPCGYFTLLCWKLAEKHYGTKDIKDGLHDALRAGCPRHHVRTDALSLLSVLQSRTAIDYAFCYKSHAVDMGLPFTSLPREVNLGVPECAASYADQEVVVPNYRGGVETVTGSYIAFGVTIPENCANPTSAEQFVRAVLSERGREILRASGFVPLQPPVIRQWGAAPTFLRGIAVRENGKGQ